ncbi:coiled-coil domain-containing protein [Planoprotostelium fungivorum]|uniref:Coiled-coil domain-containing protein n=1 Tax=Planoprotostelium fungivorum TaxID=1890364 RepID=A0A2P6NDB0_9EUKA|nr:coiled-coil domain-containing protein [Planoprotostelium fungivorum]
MWVFRRTNNVFQRNKGKLLAFVRRLVAYSSEEGGWGFDLVQTSGEKIYQCNGYRILVLATIIFTMLSNVRKKRKISSPPVKPLPLYYLNDNNAPPPPRLKVIREPDEESQPSAEDLAKTVHARQLEATRARVHVVEKRRREIEEEREHLNATKRARLFQKEEGTLRQEEDALRRLEQRSQAETFGVSNNIQEKRRRQDAAHFMSVHRQHVMDLEREDAATKKRNRDAAVLPKRDHQMMEAKIQVERAEEESRHMAELEYWEIREQTEAIRRREAERFQRAEITKALLVQRYCEAMRLKLVDKLQRANVQLEPLCGCHDDPLLHNVSYCAPNCMFYNNPHYFNKILIEQLSVYGIHLFG